jgi:hypothetical protein
MASVDVNNLLAMFRKRDEEVNNILAEMAEITSKFGNDLSENLRIVLSIEYLLIKARTSLIADLSIVKGMIIDETNSPGIRALFKQREVNMVANLSRLTELREDFNSVQKVAYTARVSADF